MQMASLLRFSLDSAHTGTVPLDREMKIVREYLEIEKARFDGRLRFELSIPEELSISPVPPLSSQTLVENSVKYAIASRREGGIVRVRASSEGACIALQVQDDGPGVASVDMPSGHGVHNLQQRLQALYGDRARLEISNRNGASVMLFLSKDQQ